MSINIISDLKTTLDLTKNRLDDLEKQMNKTEEGEKKLGQFSWGMHRKKGERGSYWGKGKRHILGRLLEETNQSRTWRVQSRRERSELLGRGGMSREAVQECRVDKGLCFLQSGSPSWGLCQSPVLWQSAGSSFSVAMDLPGTVRAGE